MSRLRLIPDCGPEDAIAAWVYEDLSEADLHLLVNLVRQQKLPVDRLGSTAVVERMASVFSAFSGIPTTAQNLFYELVRMRKSGDFPELRKGRDWDTGDAA